MEAALDLEDDLFFADLSKQISLLIMDDDDDDDQDSLAQCPSVNLQEFAQTFHPTTQASFYSYNQQTCRRETKGTGVFIPRLPHPRRRTSKQGKFRASVNKVERPSSDITRGLPHISYNNSISPSYHSFNQRTF